MTEKPRRSWKSPQKTMTKPRLVLMKGTDIVAEDGTVNQQAVKEFAAALWGKERQPKEKKKDVKGKGTDGRH